MIAVAQRMGRRHGEEAQVRASLAAMQEWIDFEDAEIDRARALIRSFGIGPGEED